MSLPRLGCVKFLNARPLIHGWRGEVLLDNPSTLCRKLAAAELDVALVSSFEFLRNPIYRIVDDISISADGPVHSVVVAHSGELADAQEIILDPASETSVALLRHLLAQRGLKPRLVARPATADFTSPGNDVAPAQLLIGDRAIRFRRSHPDFRFWDLAEEWKKTSGLPFVFALWLVRPEVAEAKAIARQLRDIRDYNLSHLQDLIARETEFDAHFCRSYYTANLRFTFGEGEKEGLRAFAKACAAQNLIPERQLQFDLL